MTFHHLEPMELHETIFRMNIKSLSQLFYKIHLHFRFSLFYPYLRISFKYYLVYLGWVKQLMLLIFWYWKCFVVANALIGWFRNSVKYNWNCFCEYLLSLAVHFFLVRVGSVPSCWMWVFSNFYMSLSRKHWNKIQFVSNIITLLSFLTLVHFQKKLF